MTWLPIALRVNESDLHLIQSIGIVAGIMVGVGSIWLGIRVSRASTHATRDNALLTVTASHREIWRRYSEAPALRHALDWEADPNLMTEEEQQWLRELILHLAASFEAGRLGVLPAAEGLDADVMQLMAKPLPRAVWRQLRPFQNKTFADYIDARLDDADRRHQGVPFGLPHSHRPPTARMQSDPEDGTAHDSRRLCEPSPRLP